MAIASQVAAGVAQTAASTNETTATVEEVKQTATLSLERAARMRAALRLGNADGPVTSFSARSRR
jgi:methyl-accepting chemotaxis protein